MDKSFRDVKPSDFDALFIPGGGSPDKLRAHDEAVSFVRAFMTDSKPVFAICHGPQLLLTANESGKWNHRMTAWKTIQGDLRKAEELETTNEELQSTVEELETTNEELQSSNEELETMNEELESTNSELQAINTDLRSRTDEVGRLNTLLRAVTGNIELGAAVLDGELRVLVWNERAADLWGIRSDEATGKSIFNLEIGLPVEKLRVMINAVLRGNGQHQEAVVEAMTRKGKTIECRVIAHTLSTGDEETGVVLLMEELKPGGEGGLARR